MLTPVELFDGQIKTLLDRQVTATILDALRNQKNEVLKRTKEIYGNMPAVLADHDMHVLFLPVIPITLMDVDKLMRLIRYDEKSGYNALMKPADLTDKIQTPQTAYYIYHVNLGSWTSSQSPRRGMANTETEYRRALTVAETLAACTHTNALTHNLFASGSRYQCDEWIPDISVGPDGPRLTWKYILEHQLKEWGTPSCMR